LKDWDTRYRTRGTSSDLPAEFLMEAIKDSKPGRALDLACGAGRNAVLLASRGWQVTGVDASSAGLKIAQSRTAALGLEIELIQADLETGEFQLEEQSFDLIIDFFYLHRALWPVIRTGLKIGGVFVAEIHLQDITPGIKPMNPEFLLAPGELLSEFRDWKIEDYSEVGRSTGLSRRTARLIARRMQA